MYDVNIYIKTTVKGPRKRDGFYEYILETQTAAGMATCQLTKEIKDATENRAELLAIVEALKRLNRSCNLHIYTDSEYVAAAIKEDWIKRWRDSGWVTAKGKEIANRDLWQKMAELLNGNLVTFHVKEHHPYTNCMEFILKQKMNNGGKQDV